MIRIHINQHQLLVSQDRDSLGSHPVTDLPSPGGPALENLLNTLDPQLPGIHYIYAPEDTFLDALYQHYTPVIAAGGLVENDRNEWLFIKRKGFWDLPKGKRAHESESFEDTALREVREECNLQKLKLEHHLVNTYHAYEERGKRWLKTTYWYMMHTTQHEGLIPQLEEDITEIRWFNKAHLEEPMGNTYPTIHEVVQAAMFT